MDQEVQKSNVRMGSKSYMLTGMWNSLPWEVFRMKVWKESADAILAREPVFL